MNVVAATGAVSPQQNRPTPEQIRIAQLIEDKKHDQPDVLEKIRKVLDVVEDSNQDDVLVALHDCDYDFEKTVALLIEKGRDVASEWRTATNHKLSKKQQKTKNGHEELDENGQQRGNDDSTMRGKSRGSRSRIQKNGGNSQNVTNQLQSDDYIPQKQRQRGNSRYRGRYRGHNRGRYRANNRNYQRGQDLNIDNLSLSDTTNPYNRDAAVVSSQQQDLWDVGNWNGETLIYSRTTMDDEQPLNSDSSSEVVVNSQSNRNDQEQSRSDFDPIEAARQIKNVIGIGQVSKSALSDQPQKSKTMNQTLTTKVTPLLAPRIPQQPVVFSDRFDGEVNKIDVQFGNLGEPFDETQPLAPAPPPSSSSAAASKFYQQSEPASSNKNSQRTIEQSSHISPSPRPPEQPMMHQQQRTLTTQIQQPQPTIPMKPLVTPQYTVHQQPQQINTPNILLQSLLYPQPEPVTLDTSYDPTAFALQSIDFNSPYLMPATMNQPPQQQTQPRYLVSQALQIPQQTSSKNAQTPSVSASFTTTKKAPAIPPGMFPSAPPPLNPAAYTTTYGVQQQTSGTNYPAPYDNEHLFANTFMPITNTQQTQSSSGTYGSVTPPVQQQSQSQTNNNNDNRTMNLPPSITENLILLQQFQQYARQQSNSQQQGQQAATHSPATLSYYPGHPASGPNYSAGLQIMYAPATPSMPQHHQGSKQQGQQYNQNSSSTVIGSNDAYYGRSSSSKKEGPYMYTGSNQPQHAPSQSAGQQPNVNKQQQQQQQRGSANVHNNRQNQQRSFQ